MGRPSETGEKLSRIRRQIFTRRRERAEYSIRTRVL
jgi:hypothetical protein